MNKKNLSIFTNHLLLFIKFYSFLIKVFLNLLKIKKIFFNYLKMNFIINIIKIFSFF